jgi:hypothetical protein
MKKYQNIYELDILSAMEAMQTAKKVVSEKRKETCDKTIALLEAVRQALTTDEGRTLIDAYYSPSGKNPSWKAVIEEYFQWYRGAEKYVLEGVNGTAFYFVILKNYLGEQVFKSVDDVIDNLEMMLEAEELQMSGAIKSLRTLCDWRLSKDNRRMERYPYLVRRVGAWASHNRSRVCFANTQDPEAILRDPDGDRKFNIVSKMKNHWTYDKLPSGKYAMMKY